MFIYQDKKFHYFSSQVILMIISKLSRPSRLSSRHGFSRDPEGFARHFGITIDEQTFQYPSSRVILPDERPIYTQEACQKVKNPQKNEDFLFFITFSRFFL